MATCQENTSGQNTSGQDQNTTGQVSMPGPGVHLGPISREY